MAYAGGHNGGGGGGQSGNSTTTKSAGQAAKAKAYHYTSVYTDDLWYLVTSIVAVATFLNLFSVYWAWRHRYALRRGVGSGAAFDISPDDKVIDTEKATVGPKRTANWRNLPAAAFAASRIYAFRRRVPHVSMTVFEVLLTVFYMLTTFLLNFLHTGNNIGFIQSRAAALCTTQFPLVVALAMKNNVIQFLTGVSHEKLNLMHRVISRVLFIQVWVNGFGLIAKHAVIWKITWRWMGVVSGVAHAIVIVTSFKSVRKWFYEFFWITHVVFVALFLIGGVWHTIGAGKNWAKYMWPCVAIWAQDRTCRYIRYLILSNFHPPNKKPAQVELLSEDTIRITVRRIFKVPLNVGRSWADFMGWKAGQHLFLAFPTIGPIESHPFTIASVCEPVDGDEKSSERELMWIVRVRSGFTKRLKEHVVAKKGKCEIPIFMDGPYGAPPDITRFGTCVFIAGGSGVAFTIPRMRDLLNHLAKRDACAKRVVFIWAIRHTDHVNWIAKDLMKSVATAPAGIELSIQIYITSAGSSSPPTLSCLPSMPSPPSPTDTETTPTASPISPMSPTPTVTAEPYSQTTMRTYSSSKNTSNEDIEKVSVSTGTASYSVDWNMKGVDVRFGRPNMHNLLEDIVTGSTGPVSVDISGPEGLVSVVRTALSSSFAGPMNILRGGATVQLNVEDFTM